MEIDKIKINPNNPRFIKDEKFKSLVKSLIELPVMTELREIVVDEDNVIIGGNMRYRAAKEAGWKEIPTKVFTRAMADENNKLTNQTKTYEDYCKEIMIKDNISGGEWDWELLSSQFEKEELEDWGLDIDKWKEDEVIEDEVPEVAENPVSKLGEIYQLGRHRIMCGDSTKIEDVEKLMDGKKADMVFTDPPYNMGYTGSATARREKIANDDIVDFPQFCIEFMACYVVSCKVSAPYYVFTNEKEIQTIREAFVANGLTPSQLLIWKKQRIGFGGADYQHTYEPFIYGYKEHKTRYFVDDRTLSDVWEFARPASSDLHPTMKPIELIAYGLNKSSKSEDIVLDLFLGSGSTLIACEQTNRICYGMEIDEKYCDVIRKRYAKFINSEDWESATPKIL